jgi:ribonucleoside-diphosphate reductase beta chain
VGWFPKHEIQQMAMMFGSQETIHAVAYSYLNETLGLENFEAFLHEPATAARFDNLVSYNGNNPVGIGRSLAVFSAFAEGVSLYSAFAVLYSFQLRNLLKGIGQQMKWSVRDESLHSKMGCQLFRHMCEEIKGLQDDCYEHVIKAAKTMLKAEERYIDKMFEQGDIENLKAYDLKQFIRKRLNEKIVELGYSNSGKYFEYDEVGASDLDWFYHLTGGHTHTDFFSIRPTDYSKANEGEDFEDIW